MKKIISIVLILFSITMFSQEYYSRNYELLEFSLPKIRQNENFFFTEWEINLSESPNQLSEIETLKKANTNKNQNYLIEKLPNGTTSVVVTVNKKTFSESIYKKGLLEGKKTIYHANGNPFQVIEYKNGKVNGLCKIYNEQQELILETNYKDNFKNGIRKMFSQNRSEDCLEGNYINGYLVGNLKYTDGNRTYILPNDLKKGNVKQFYKDKLITEFYIINDEDLHGDAKRYNPETGKLLIKMPYYLGKKNGTAEVYNNEGELLSRNEYKQGKKIGTHKTFSNDKKLLKEEYYDSEGIKTGVWKEYDKNGALYTEQQYKNDSLNGSSKRYSQGFLQENSEYKNGKREGLCKYYKSGTSILASDVYYSKDYFYKEIVYYDYGTTFSIREIDQKTKNVSVKYYNPDGTFFHENKFLDDNIAVGLIKFLDKEPNGFIVRNETVYDGKKNRLKEKSYSYKRDGSYTEHNFRNNNYHGESKSFNAETNETKIIYYYESNNKHIIVSKEEFEKLTLAEKK
jgi:uncharacterized protein